MSILIIQTTIKQWDKSQRSNEHVQQRAQIPVTYPILFPPAYYLVENRFIIDQHGDADRQIKISLDDNGKLNFDRFQLCIQSNELKYLGDPETGEQVKSIGSIDNQWVQCQYDWRYRVFKEGFYFWQYEEVTLNIISMEKLDENVFINSKPVINV
jgi:hypothetical protein